MVTMRDEFATTCSTFPIIVLCTRLGLLVLFLTVHPIHNASLQLMTMKLLGNTLVYI